MLRVEMEFWWSVFLTSWVSVERRFRWLDTDLSTNLSPRIWIYLSFSLALCLSVFLSLVFYLCLCHFFPSLTFSVLVSAWVSLSSRSRLHTVCSSCSFWWPAHVACSSRLRRSCSTWNAQHTDFVFRIDVQLHAVVFIVLSVLSSITETCVVRFP